MKSIAQLFLVGLAWVCGLAFNGFTIACLWKWFISAAFGIAEITILQAIGIDLLLTYICAPTIPKINEPQKSIDVDNICSNAGRMLATVFGQTVTVLLIGWAIHLFMQI